MEHSSSPIDGFTLCEALHNKSVKILYINIKINALVQLKSKLDSPTNLTIFFVHFRGINIRYLGKVAEMISKYSSVSYVYVSINTQNFLKTLE